MRINSISIGFQEFRLVALNFIDQEYFTRFHFILHAMFFFVVLKQLKI